MMQLLFCFLISFLAFSGIAVDLKMDPPEKRRQKFVYYTNLSNLITAVHQLLLLLALTAGTDTGLFSFVADPTLRFSLTLCVFVTFVIYAAVLAPYFKKHDTLPKHPLRKYSNLCVHYFVPLLTAAEWLLFADKNVSFAGCFSWLLIPLLYSVFIMLRALTGVRLAGPRSSLYPYAFMDAEKLGWKKVIFNSIFIFAFFIALTVIFYFITKLF